ncbi:MAG: sel1 repeat family protein [Rhodospirillales bacterium]|nr:sel1 repeat family protein [Rhodospirillales bacterium]MBO6786210.1 sel1 repeat family protein [Rhodospirillales bacterium]
MTFRFIFWMILVCLVFSGTAGWIFYGDREPDPEEAAIQAYKVALDSERRAAETGDVEDWTRYARSLATGPAQFRNPKEAMHWYRKAADRGYAPAQVGIGDLFAHGAGVREDHYRAQEWYSTAARLSKNAEAHFKAGEGYFRGLGVPQDYGAALSYYQVAASQGHPVAQYLIGSMYEAGWGVERDLIEAWVWYNRALPKAAFVSAHEKDYDVARALARTEQHMNQSQLDVARKRLAEAANRS